MFRLRFFGLLIPTLVLSTLALPSPARATTLEDSVAQVVAKLAKYLESKNETSISIGQFVGPPQLSATSGPGISKVFHDHFGRQNIEVRRRSNIGLRGEFALVDAPGGHVGVRLNCSLVDPLGQVLTDFSVDAELVDKHQDIVQLVGATTKLHPEDLPSDQYSDLKKSILHPSLHIDGGLRCSASPDSPYQMEVVVDGKALPIQVLDGQGFINIRHGDIYKIRLYNNSDFDAAVRLSIDGLGVFTFSQMRNPKTNAPKYNNYIVPAHRFVEIAGWHKSNEVVSSFLVTGYAGSAAATINHQQDIGTITAVFAAAWPKGGNPPPDENLTGRGDNATGFGPPIQQVIKEVRRNIGQMRSSISLRYDK